MTTTTMTTAAPHTRLVQTFLDFGQSDLCAGKTCARCGMLYTDLDEDVVVHARYCRHRRRRRAADDDNNSYKSSKRDDGDDGADEVARGRAAAKALATLCRQRDDNDGRGRHRVRGIAGWPCGAYNVTCEQYAAWSLCDACEAAALPSLLLCSAAAASCDESAAYVVYVLQCTPHTRRRRKHRRCDDDDDDDSGMCTRATTSTSTTRALQELLYDVGLDTSPSLYGVARTCDADGSRSGATRAAAHVVVVVVDDRLRCVLCAAAAHAHTRTHTCSVAPSPPLRGCDTLQQQQRRQQHTTYADVDDVWLLPPHALRRARQAADADAAATAASSPHAAPPTRRGALTRDALQAFFAPRQTCDAATATTTKATAAATRSCDDDVTAHTACVRAALRVCLHTLSRRVLYGCALHARDALSYADVVLHTLHAWLTQVTQRATTATTTTTTARDVDADAHAARALLWSCVRDKHRDDDDDTLYTHSTSDMVAPVTTAYMHA